MRHSKKLSKVLVATLIACLAIPQTASSNAFFRYKSLENGGFEEVSSDIQISASGTLVDKQSRINGDAPDVSYSATGGSGSYTWSLDGPLPAGITFSNGSFSGSATQTGSFPITISATDGELTGSLSDIIIIRPDLMLAASPTFTGRVNNPMGAVIGVSGDIGTLTWQITGGDPLTDGITLESGVVSGTPTTEEDTSVQVTVTDDYDGQTATTTANFQINGEFFVTATSYEINGRVGNAITPVTFTANGLTGSAEWLVQNSVAGNLYGMNAAFAGGSGTISGTPTQSYFGEITISARDAANTSWDRTDIDVSIADILTVDLATTHEFGGGSSVSISPILRNAVGDVSWALTSGTLPSWASLDTTDGSITGTTDTFATTSGLVLTATDSSDGATASTDPFSITVSSGLHLALSTDDIRARTGVQETWLRATSSGNTVPVSWSLDTSTLPTGSAVTIDGNGVVSGTFSEAGSFSIDVIATEGADPLAGNVGASATETVSVTVSDPLLVGEVLLSGTGYDVATSLDVDAPEVTNGIGTLSYDIYGDPFPFSVSLNPATGRITGNSSEANSSGVSCVMVTDDWDGSEVCSPTFTILINDVPVAPELAEFKPVTNAEPSQLTYSNIVAIEAQTVAMEVTVTGDGAPEIRALCDSCDDEAYGETVSLPTNETFKLQLRATSAEALGDTVATNALFSFQAASPEDITVGWPITNKEEDGDPDTMVWDNSSYLNEYPDTLVEYARAQTVTGINIPVTVSVSGPGNPEISFDNGATWVTSGEIENDESFLIRQTSDTNQGGTVAASIDVGPDSYTWTVRTGVYDDEPIVSITNRDELVTDELIVSNYVVPHSYNMPITVSVAGDGQPEIRIPGGDWVTEATITPGTGFNVRANAPATTSTVNTIEITAGQTFRNWLLETCRNVVEGVCGILIQTELGEVFPSDADTENSFGDGITVHGTTAVVSRSNDPANFGSVYIFEQIGQGWVQTQKIVAPNSYTSFGSSTAIHTGLGTDVLVVGAPNYGTGGRGRAYIYEREGNGSFELISAVNASDNGTFDKFGSSVATNGDTVAIGSPWHGGSILSPHGAIYTFEKSDEDWLQTGKYQASDKTGKDYLGGRVRISDFGTIVTSVTRRQRVYTFEVFDGGGTEDTVLTASDGEEHDGFGTGLGISGNVIVVGAPGAGEHNNGKAYVFGRSGVTWSEGVHLTAADEPGYYTNVNFGDAAAISGDTIVIGAPFINVNDNAVIRGGSLYTFRGNGTWSWNPSKRLILSTAAMDDRMGFVVATNGHHVLSSRNNGPGSFFYFDN